MLQAPKLAPQLQSLPVGKELELHQLLQWHAQALLDSDRHPPESRRRRMRGKQPRPLRHVLEDVARDPQAEQQEEPLTWEQRRDATNYAAQVYAHHTGLTVRASRAVVQLLWKDGSEAAKKNFYVFQERLGNPGPSAEMVAGRSDQPTRPVYAGMFTWQTPHGRKKDAVDKLRQMQLSVEDMAEVLRGDSLLKGEFEEFTVWAAAMVSQTGFDVWSASMELNSVSSNTNIVHLHLYVALRWDKFKSREWEPIVVLPANWVWHGFLPHFRAACMKGNSNPNRALFQGLYYLLAPKTGSIFRQGNREVFKDRGAACGALPGSDGCEANELSPKHGLGNLPVCWVGGASCGRPSRAPGSQTSGA